MKNLFKKVHRWLNEPVGGWDKYWEKQITQYSSFAQDCVHAAVQSYLIKWQMYYHQTKEYDTTLCLTLEDKVIRFLEDETRNNCK